ncbi:MAG TPA: LuxR family transcriptional regulator, partial [Streptosporangiaceae bacterium]|nr:LuxR family transcriptional regulator [Streptosporangiaceae bacterium]
MLLERADELRALDTVLNTGGVLVIEGGAGIGKTSLLRLGSERAARSGWRVLRGTGSELETGFAFGVVRQLFERELAAAEPAQRAQWLAGPAAAVRGLLGAPDTAPDPFAVVHGLYWLTVNMAACPRRAADPAGGRLHGRPGGGRDRGRLAIEAGELDEAQALLELIPPGPAGVLSVLAPAAAGRLGLARGDGRQALTCFQACLAMFGSDVWGIEIRDVGYLHARSGAAQAWLLLGDRDRARALAEAELADARVSGGRRALGIALRVAGLAAGGADGLERLTESAGILRESPALLERAKSIAELGAALRRAGHRAAARPLLAEALDLAVGCGARPLASHLHVELAAAGGRPRRERRHGLDALTPSELRVARLAADGQTNRQIAHGLYVTLKTVETHLAHV